MHRRTTSKTFGHAKQLHRNLTPAEVRLWSRLRGHRMKGVHFRNQNAIGNYVVDFWGAAQKTHHRTGWKSAFGSGKVLHGKNCVLRIERLPCVALLEASSDERHRRRSECYLPCVGGLIDRILAAKRANPQADTSALDAEIGRLVHELFGLN